MLSKMLEPKEKKIVSREQLKKDLDKKIDAVLERWQTEDEEPGDGFDILRWARKGYLVRKN